MTHISTTYYSVAEHLFAIESSNDALLSMLNNYEPFLVDSPQDNPLFILRIEQEGLLQEEQRGGYHHVFTDNSEEDMPRIEVYREARGKEGGWLMRVSQIASSPICCEIACNATFTEGILYIAKDYRDVRFCMDNALMLMFAFRTAPLMTLEMHAAVVVKPCLEANGERRTAKGEELGCLFLGHSGTGKSTHARQWLAAFPDVWLLNDDNPILRVMDNGEVRVYGSPWSGKTPCYKNAYARVGGIIKLSQAPFNEIQPLTLPQAYAYMLSSASGLKIDQQMADQLYNSIKHIITHVKCFHLNCLPNTEAAEVCYQAVKCKG